MPKPPLIASVRLRRLVVALIMFILLLIFSAGGLWYARHGRRLITVQLGGYQIGRPVGWIQSVQVPGHAYQYIEPIPAGRQLRLELTDRPVQLTGRWVVRRLGIDDPQQLNVNKWQRGDLTGLMLDCVNVDADEQGQTYVLHHRVAAVLVADGRHCLLIQLAALQRHRSADPALLQRMLQTVRRVAAGR